MNKATTIKPNVLIACLALVACFSVYAITMTENRLGYESETIEQARALVRGEPAYPGRAGMFDVVLYAPWVAVAEVASQLGALPVFQELLPNFALPLCMALTVVCVLGMLREIFPLRLALLGAGLFAFGTMAWPYAKMGMETGLTLASALAGWGMVRVADSRRSGGWALMAAGLGLMLLTKVHAPLVIILHLVWAIAVCSRGQAPWPTRRAWLSCAVAAVLAAGLFVVGNYWRFGRWIFSTRYSLQWETAPPDSYFANLAGFFVSPGKSIFIYCPALILALFGLREWLRRPGSREMLIVVLVPQILFHAYFRTWADETWGPRRLLNLIPLLMLPVTTFIQAAFDAPTSSRRTFRFAFIASISVAALAMQLNAVAMNYASYIQTLQPEGYGTQHNLAWNPATTHYRFQAILLRSWFSRERGGPSWEFVADPRWHSARPEDFLPWNAPEQFKTVAAEALPLSAHDQYPDFWWAQRIHHFAGRSPWQDKAFYLFVVLLCAAAASLGALVWIAIRADKDRSKPASTSHAIRA